MLASIGIILIAKQIPLALGYDEPDFWRSGFLDLFSTKNFLGNFREFSHHITPGSIIISICSLIAMAVMQQPFANKFNKIPAPLFAVLIGLLLNYLFSLFSPALALKPSQLVHIPSNIFSSIQFPDFTRCLPMSKYGKMALLSVCWQRWKLCYVLKP